MSDNRICLSCGVFLTEPYISCCDCRPSKLFLCCSCFSKGTEIGSHQNSHSYIIVRNNFHLFESQWTASEEMKLLDAIVECGIGNWYDIASLVGSKSKEDCEAHYTKCYIYKPQNGLSEPSKPDFSNEFWENAVPYRICEEPPHPSTSSQLFKELVGYMPARGDFGVDYDNYAELDIKDLDFENKVDYTSDIEEEVSLAALDVYNKRLKARAKRKWILREYGLISRRRTILTMHRYSKTLGTGLLQKIIRFSRFLSAIELDYLFEGFHKEEEVKQKIVQLQEYRNNGLTKHHSISMYIKSKVKRENELMIKRTALNDVLNHVMSELSMRQWLQRQILSRGGSVTPVSAGRRAAPPLNISGLPGIERLDASEKELCSTLRLIPNIYLQFKSVLTQECEKLGGLKLSNARSLIKIDVNKTRKVYDFLIEQGTIHKM